jgi:hypothetical protein
VNRRQLLDTLDFDHDLVFNDQVRSMLGYQLALVKELDVSASPRQKDR